MSDLTDLLRGIIPPLVTPIDAEYQLDQHGLERLINRTIEAGCSGLFILGTTGEGPSVGRTISHQLIESTANLSADRVPFYVGITDTSLSDAVELAEHAAEHQAAAVVAAPPYYFPAGQTELHHWYVQLADAIPLPLLLYNIPSCTEVAIELDTLASLAEHPNIIGLKDSSGDLKYLGTAIEIGASQPQKWPVLVGPEVLLPEAMALGATGGVTGGANLAPRLFTDFYSALESNDRELSQRLAATVRELQELYGFGKYESSYLKGLKCAMELTGVCAGQLAPPFDAFKEPEREKVQRWLQQFAAPEYLPST